MGGRSVSCGKSKLVVWAELEGEGTEVEESAVAEMEGDEKIEMVDREDRRRKPFKGGKGGGVLVEARRGEVELDHPRRRRTAFFSHLRQDLAFRDLGYERDL